MIASERIWRWTALAMCVVIAAIVTVAPGPDQRLRSAIAIHDFGHVVAFGLVTALLAFTLSSWSRPTTRQRLAITLLAAVASIALGAAVEVAQAVSGGYGDPWDVVRDSGGAGFAALILIALDPIIVSSVRAALVGAAIVLLAAFAYPTAAALEDEARARAQFPVLADFETTRQLSRFHFGEGIEPRIVQVQDSDGQPISAIHLRLPAGQFPGFGLDYFPEDWRSMRALQLSVINPESSPINLSVRIDDADETSLLGVEHRYTRSFPLPPGANKIEIPLSDVAAAPRNRRLDLGNIRLLLVFAVDLEQPHGIIVGPITLLR